MVTVDPTTMPNTSWEEAELDSVEARGDLQDPVTILLIGKRLPYDVTCHEHRLVPSQFSPLSSCYRCFSIPLLLFLYFNRVRRLHPVIRCQAIASHQNRV